MLKTGELVAQGQTLDEFKEIAQVLDETWEEKQCGRILWTLANPLTPEEMALLRSSLEDNGVYVFETPPQSNTEVDAVIQCLGDMAVILNIEQIVGNPSYLIIDFQKRLGPFVILGVVLGALLALPIIALGWKLFTMGWKGIMMNIVLPLSAVVLAGLTIKWVVNRTRKDVAPAAASVTPWWVKEGISLVKRT